MKSFAKKGVLVGAQAFGVTPNVLGAKLGYEKGSAASVMTESEAKFLLCPHAVCHVVQRFPDETLFFTNVLSRAGGCVFCGEQGDNITLSPEIPFDEAAADLLENHLCRNEPTATGVNFPLNTMQAAVLLALADALRRRRISCLLAGRIANLDFDLDNLRREMDFAASEQDLRWLLPFLQNAAGETLLDDSTLPVTLASFGDSPLLSVSQDGTISLTKAGMDIVDALSKADAFLSATSLFYENDEPYVMAILLLSGKGYSFYLELSAQGFFCTCDYDGGLAAVATMLASVDVPAFPASVETVPVAMPAQASATPKQQPAAPVQSPSNTSWQCVCGNMNKGEFCPQCGTKRSEVPSVPADGSWQCVCGRRNEGGFCPQCGTKRSEVPSVPTDESWLCACGRRNKGKFCPKCGAKRLS